MAESLDLVNALADEVNRIHLAHVCTSENFADWPWTIVSRPEPCETCGTRVFALRDEIGTIELFHIGYIRKVAGRDRCTAAPHTAKRCSAARRFGVRLEGKTPLQMRALTEPPKDANPQQTGLFE